MIPFSDVLLKDQGLQAIQVSDDGQGISEQDLLLLGKTYVDPIVKVNRIEECHFKIYKSW